MLYLASSSPRRRALCNQIGLVYHILNPDIVETPMQAELPRVYAARMAQDKALAASVSKPDWKEGDVLIAADTVVAAGRRILPKTNDRAQAERYWQMFSGRRIRVWGGIAVWHYDNNGWRVCHRLVETRLKFARVDQRAIVDYLDTDEWRGCAGGFAIQGTAAKFIIAVQGSYNNVVGLDLATLWCMLPADVTRQQ